MMINKLYGNILNFLLVSYADMPIANSNVKAINPYKFKTTGEKVKPIANTTLEHKTKRYVLKILEMQKYRI